MAVTNNIREIREQRGIYQDDLAAAIGYSTKTVGRIERGDSTPRLLDIRENVRGAIKTTDKDIAKTALLAKEFREAGQTAANAFRTFADKPEVDYSQKEQKHPISGECLEGI